MKLSREDLLEQKAALEKVLAWVNARLRELDGEAQDSPQPETPPPAAEPIGEAKASVAIVETKAARPAADYEPTQGITKANQVGCIAIAVAAVLLVLFLLFGLPFLLY